MSQNSIVILLIQPGRDFKGYFAYINSIKSNPNIIMAGGGMDGLPMQGSMSTMYSHFHYKTLKAKVKELGITDPIGKQFSVAAIVVLLTVYFHSYKASRTNPADALR